MVTSGHSQAASALDDELLVKLHAVHTDGCLARTNDATVVGLWSLDGAAVAAELLHLAVTPPRVREVNPVLSATGTPLIFEAFKGMLFVAMAHNLTLESYVSDLANLEKIHTHMHALTLHYLFMYKKHQTGSRRERLAPELRSMKGGGARAAAKVQSAIGKQRKGSANMNKPQQLLLCKQVRESALTFCTAALYVCGPVNIRRRLHLQRKRHDEVARNVAACAVAARRSTYKSSTTGRARGGPRTTTACKRLMGATQQPAQLGDKKVAKRRSNVWKDVTVWKEATAAEREKKAAAKVAKAGQATGQKRQHAARHGTGKQEMRAVRKAASSADPKRKAPSPSAANERRSKAPRLAAVKAVQAVAAAGENESEDEGGDEGWEGLGA